MPDHPISLHDPLIEITRDGDLITAYSRLYDDIYFSSASGYAESMAVFVEPTELAARFKSSALTTIAELGFGTGLNFCLALSLFRQTAPNHARLHYIAAEHAPLTDDQICAVLSAFPELHQECDDVIAALPPRWPGRHRVFLDQGRVTLDLIYQDAYDMLSGSDFAADVWFLDGFTPSRNPDMWQDDMFRHMARCSAKDAVCASFSAAGSVRRGLELAGFDITRHAGFGQKRHRITGVLSNRVAGRSAPASASGIGRVKIIGAGIAGASLAAALARRQIDVEVLEAAPAAADGASGNIAALQSPRLTASYTDHGWLSLNAFGFARRSALAMGAGLSGAGNSAGMGTGMGAGLVTLAKDDREAVRQQKLLAQAWPKTLFHSIDDDVLSNQLGIELPYDEVTQQGLHYPYAGAVDPRQWVNALLQGVPCRYEVQIHHLSASHDAIILTDQYGNDIAADVVVIAAGIGLSALWGKRLEPILPITGNRGHVSHLPADADIKINLPMSFGGYLAQASDGSYALGASYQRLKDGDDLGSENQRSFAAHQENYARLPDTLKQHLSFTPDQWQGRQSVRATTPDRQPIAGALGNGIYVLGGLGSRGMVTAPLLAEAIAADICQEPSPLDTAMRRAVDPFRFSRRAGL
ncbi:MAG: FAD-dependent 5-carboxymethylaminomethyl-2-thiouridine(34) oxidoreductase MnmC [Alphaproteobacteria bacterium]|nr:FAD-dependent 5-carboxymethylaminomethyl-2-thiouridine(34) oxidoreductase MnmC [Alphaproteobacteria bacterium]